MARLARKQDRVLRKNHGSNLALKRKFGVGFMTTGSYLIRVASREQPEPFLYDLRGFARISKFALEE
jgi:hypothetical protein